VRFDRATGTLLTLTAVTGMVVALAATPVAAMGATGTASSPASGPRQQAIVSLAGSSKISAPGVRVITVLSGIHAEIVDATVAGLAALAATPGVTGISPNAKAHLESDSFGTPEFGWPQPIQHPNPTPSASASPTPSPSPSPSSSSSPAPSPSPSASPSPSVSPSPSASASPSPSASPTPEGVSAAQSVGGSAGKASAGRGVTVAVIDTGVSDTPGLNRASGRLVDAVDTSGLNTPNGKVVEHGQFTDGFGHGTFMASLIAGGPHSSTDTLGVGVAPGATIDVVKVADDQGNTSLAAVLAGLNWVATHSDSVDVANLSLSVDRPSAAYGIDPLNFAVTLTRAAGVTVVVAAGNTPGILGDPGFDPAALTVGAADTTGATPTVADFSGSDNVDGVSKPDVVAAGVSILGEMPANAIISQQFPGARQPSGLFRGSGTSQSTAIVSGIAAIYLQAHQNASPQQVKSAIRDAANGISGNGDGQGLVTIPTRNYGSSDTGESSLNTNRFNATASQWGSVFNDDTFAARRWAARRWAGDGWDARRWAANLWAGVSFDARRWANLTWATDSWDARRWAASSWDGTS
jgi:serine protease AprX